MEEHLCRLNKKISCCVFDRPVPPGALGGGRRYGVARGSENPGQALEPREEEGKAHSPQQWVE